MKTNEKLNLTMLCDFYELTMGNGYFVDGKADQICYFDVFFRNVPDGGGFAIAAGLEQVVEYIRDLHFSEDDLAYLRNKAKLSRNDAKFYVITVSPSSRELEKMGKTEKEQAEAMRRYVRDDVMQHYAEGFGKGLNKEDIEYYGKIHFERKGADRYDMHAHIIVSRKDRSNTRKLSPKTNHTGKKNCGNVKGGFDRTDFFRKCETSFDKRTGYDRAPEQTFDYLNTMKNGTPKEIFQKKEWAERVNHERLEKMKAEWNRDLQEQHQEQGREESQQQGNSISQVPEINQAPQRKKQLEEELDQPRKKSRGFGMGM